MVCPLGVAEQFTLSSEGERMIKYRLTHDQTFHKLPSSKSVNNLTDKSKFHELIYGFCLQRIIYQALSMRYHFPYLRILCSKYDFAKAYRRLHYGGLSAAQCIAIFGEYAYMMLRLSFGGAGCPPTWCAASELITDLANDIVSDPSWTADPPLLSPEQDLVPPPTRLPDDIPLARTLPSMLLPPPRPHGMSDVFVDDVITLFVDTPQNCKRAPAAVPLAIHTVARPPSPDEPLPRESMLSHEKLLAEGSASEIKIILGWKLDFRRLIISLPSEKYDVWKDDLLQISTMGKCTKKELEKLLGRLNHAAAIIPLARFFLGRLYAKHSTARYSRSKIHFNKSDRKIFKIWTQFLDQANHGISFNLLSIRVPTNITITDACPGGLGGVLRNDRVSVAVQITRP